MRALALFSGGLDSGLAIKVVQNQGIEVIAINFVSHFFGGKNEKADRMAEQLGCQLEYIDFKEIHRALVENPPSGYGKNMNPCIDCHALMFRLAGELLEKYDAKFIISGEILGQRPMSQNYTALARVGNLSGVKELILRPLSAKCLPVTKVEENGWIDREKLMNIQGRTRKRQMELAIEYGLVEYPTPGGGCLLTDPAYSKRLKILKEDNCFDNEHIFRLTQFGRMFRLDAGKYIFVGRKEEENYKISEEKEAGTIHIMGAKTPGPAILGVGEFSEDEKEFVKELFSRYSKDKGKNKITAIIDGEIAEIEAPNLVELEEKMKKYMLV